MSTASNGSSRVSDLQVVTSLVIAENNNAETNSTSETNASGLFVTPSTVTGRSADVTGFLVTSLNDLGKLEFSDPDGFLSLDQLSDVVITSPAANEFLIYNGTSWVNSLVSKATVTQITSITTGVTINSPAGVITTVGATTGVDATESFTVTNSSVAAASVVIASVQGYGGTQGRAIVTVDTVAAGSFVVDLTNVGTAILDGAVDIGFYVL